MTATPMLLDKATTFADCIVKVLAPHCMDGMCLAAGSIRRQCATVGDIDIVCMPRTVTYDGDLFGGSITTRVRSFGDAVRALPDVQILSGSADTGRMVSLIVDGVKVQLFIADGDNWGYILAIRTGSADWAHHVMMQRLKDCRYEPRDGYLHSKGHIVPVPDERTLFKLMHIPFIEPCERANTAACRIKCKVK